jgi:DSF synthase
MSTFQAKQALLERPGDGETQSGAPFAPFPLEPSTFDFSSWNLRHLELEFESDPGMLWMRFTHPERPCFSAGLLEDLWEVVHRMNACGRLGLQPEGFHYLVRASKRADVWCYGGDLDHFAACIRAGDAEALRRYAHRCVDLVYHNYRSFDLPITTIGLVQGDALGGGFESLLSDDVIIAERGVRMGMPEILFNLFPGMGAYSFLARKVGGGLARRMITSGELFTAEQLYDMGVVDVLANPGEGEAALRQYVAKNARRRRTLDVLRAVDRRSQEVTYEELIDVTDLWVERALELEPQDLRKMQRLAHSQSKRSAA